MKRPSTSTFNWLDVLLTTLFFAAAVYAIFFFESYRASIWAEEFRKAGVAPVEVR